MTGCAAISGALPNFGISKETCLLTPRGGFLDGRNQNRDPEPSAKTFHDSARREPPNSRGLDVLPTNVLQQILPMLRTHHWGFPNFWQTAEPDLPQLTRHEHAAAARRLPSVGILKSCGGRLHREQMDQGVARSTVGNVLKQMLTDAANSPMGIS